MGFGCVMLALLHRSDLASTITVNGATDTGEDEEEHPGIHWRRAAELICESS